MLLQQANENLRVCKSQSKKEVRRGLQINSRPSAEMASLPGDAKTRIGETRAVAKTATLPDQCQDIQSSKRSSCEWTDVALLELPRS